MQAHGKITILAAGIAFLFSASALQAGVLLPEGDTFQSRTNQIQGVQPLSQTVKLPEVFQWIYPDVAWSLPGSLSASELMNPSLIPLVDSQVAGIRASSGRPGFSVMLPFGGGIIPGPGRRPPTPPPVIPEPASTALGFAALCGALAGIRVYRIRKKRAE